MVGSTEPESEMWKPSVRVERLTEFCKRVARSVNTGFSCWVSSSSVRRELLHSECAIMACPIETTSGSMVENGKRRDSEALGGV